MGDLNTTMWSSSFQQLLKVGSLTDTRLGQGVLPSWTLLPEVAGFPLLPLDFALISGGFSNYDLDRVRLIGSDHWGMVLKIAG
jgi:endonuclease/exonuclease/phosphatase (EEP) superfamily protein YafD